jgi:hypothetical protein
LVFLYVFYHYVWIRDREFTNWLGGALYLALPAAATGILLAVLRLSPTHKINTALCCVALLLSIYGAEVTLALTLSGDDHGEQRELAIRAALAKRMGRSFDVRSRGEVIADLRKDGIDAVGRVPPYLFLSRTAGAAPLRLDGVEVIPLAGISDRLTVLCNESGEWVTYRSDEHGFHNPRGLWSARPLDVLLVGDSFTHGVCVPSNKNFVAAIRHRYPKTISLGYAGNGPFLQFAALSEFGAYLRPRVVFWCYYEGNDLSDLRSEQESGLLRDYLRPDFNHGLVRRQQDVDRALEAYFEDQFRRGIDPVESPRQRRSVFQQIAAYGKLSTLRRRFQLVYGTQHAEQIDQFRDILLQAQRRVTGWGGALYFVYLPTWSTYSTGPNPAQREARAAVLAVVHNLGIPLIDVHGVFAQMPDPLSLFPLRQPGHYTEDGNGVVAAAILEAIPTNELPSASGTPR